MMQLIGVQCHLLFQIVFLLSFTSLFFQPKCVSQKHDEEINVYLFEYSESTDNYMNPSALEPRVSTSQDAYFYSVQGMNETTLTQDTSQKNPELPFSAPTPHFNATPMKRNDVDVFRNMLGMVAQLFSNCILGNMNLYGPPKYYLCLGRTMELSKEPIEFKKDFVLSLEMKADSLPLRLFEKMNYYLMQGNVLSFYVYYRPRRLKSIGPTLLNLVDKGRIPMASNQKELKKKLNGIGEKMKWKMDPDSYWKSIRNEEVLFQFISFQWTWLYRFHRDYSKAWTFVTQNGTRVRTLYSFSSQSYVVANTSNYFAVKLPFRKLSTFEDMFSKDIPEPMKEWAVYLIGPKNSTTPLPHYSARFLRHVHLQLKRNTSAVEIGIPSFRILGTIQLSKLQFLSSSRTMKNTFSVHQTTSLCVDDIGVNRKGLRRSHPRKKQGFPTYIFGQTFHFSIVLEESGIPIFSKRVDAVMKDMGHCLSD